MSLYNKLRRLMRVTAEDPAKKLVEMNDIKIFEQEIKEAEGAVKAAKLHLAKVKADANSISNSVEELSKTIALREKQTIEAMDKDHDLALDLASLLADDEIALKDLELKLKKLSILEGKLTSDLRKAVQIIQSHYRELQILKANERNENGKKPKGNNGLSINGSLRELKESLNNIKQRQLREAYLDEAENDIEDLLSGKNLNQRLIDSGIDTGQHNARAVLDRLRMQKSA